VCPYEVKQAAVSPSINQYPSLKNLICGCGDWPAIKTIKDSYRIFKNAYTEKIKIQNCSSIGYFGILILVPYVYNKNILYYYIFFPI